MTIFKIYPIIFVSLFILNCQFIPFFMDDKGVLFKIKVEAKDKNNKEIAKQAADIFERRLNAIGVRGEAKLSSDSNNSAEVEVKVFGQPDIELVKKVLLYEADLALMQVDSPPNPNLAAYPTREAALQTIGGAETSNRKVFKYTERDNSTVEDPNAPAPPEKWIVVEYPAIINGDQLRDASAVSRTGNEGDYQISFSLKPVGAKNFGEWTGQNIGNYMAVVINDEAKSVAFIQSQIFDQGQISGQFTKAGAEELALILKSGHLPAKLTLLEEKTFGDKTEK